MQIKAYAKINLALDVVGKRQLDGYHLLKMIMQTIDLYDTIEVKKIEKDIILKCNKNYVPLDNRNLAYKAAELFMDRFDIKSGVEINIDKNIPVSAGLAGGSTDAAAVLKAMNTVFEVGADKKVLEELALKIGADVPYCIDGGTALCEGVGEIITKLPSFKNYILVLVKPPFGVSTKEVYGSLDIKKIYKHPDVDNIMKAMEEGNLEFVASNMKNVLENVTLRKHKILTSIKNEMIRMEALGSLMSGSGPSVFAFFDDMLKAQRCYDRMKSKFDEVYITRTI